MADEDPAVSVAFKVKIDGQDLGMFNSCEGLGVEVVLEQREEGGNNRFVWQLPTRMKYTNIKLSRPLTKDTAKVTKWLASVANAQSKQTGHIDAMTVDGTVVASWALEQVVPVRWTGPSLNVETPKVATETIEIAHHGFLPASAQSSGQN